MRFQYFSYIFFCLLPFTLQAQQLPVVAFYRHNWTALNPAAMPREAIELRQVSTLLNLNYRRQHHIVPSQAPTIVDARIEHLLSNDGDNYTKLAAFVNSENDGIINTMNLSANYARLMKLDLPANRARRTSYSFGDLALGGTLTFRHRAIRLEAVNWKGASLPPGLPPIINHNYLSLNMGGFWYFNLPNMRKWREQVMQSPYEKQPYGYLGVSTIQTVQAGKTDFFHDVNHWNGIVGIVWQRLELSTWLRYVPNLVFLNQSDKTYPLSTDVNLKYFYKFHGGNVKDKNLGDAFWVGGGLTSASTVNLECGYRRWLQKGFNSNCYYLQVGVAYTGFPISSQAITRPSNLEINMALNFAQNGNNQRRRRR
jgi:Type IX secretion system membrane protein PorP/SprF